MRYSSRTITWRFHETNETLPELANVKSAKIFPRPTL